MVRVHISTSTPTDAQMDNLINFKLRCYDQDGDGSTTDNIHKVADITIQI